MAKEQDEKKLKNPMMTGLLAGILGMEVMHLVVLLKDVGDEIDALGRKLDAIEFQREIQEKSRSP